METNPEVTWLEGMPSGNGHANGHSNGNGQTHGSERYEAPEAYLAYNEVSLASDQDRWFQQAYRAGYVDGFAQGLKHAPAAPATVAPIAAPVATAGNRPESRLNAKTDHREQRLRGFPCAVCGCSSYNDETRCPCCGSPKEQSPKNIHSNEHE